MTSPRDVTGADDVIKEQVLGAARRPRTRGFNESFRAAVDRSYTNRQSATRGEHCMYFICTLSTHDHFTSEQEQQHVAVVDPGTRSSFLFDRCWPMRSRYAASAALGNLLIKN